MLPLCSEYDLLKNFIPVILLNAKISFGHFIRRMIIDADQHCRLYALLPGMISEGFAKGMTADHAGDIVISCHLFDDAKSLHPTDVFIFIAVRKKILFWLNRFLLLSKLCLIILKTCMNIMIDIDAGGLSRLLFNDLNMLLPSVLRKVINIFPPQSKQIRNPQCSIQAQDH